MYSVTEAVLAVLCTHKGLSLPAIKRFNLKGGLTSSDIADALKIGVRQVNYALVYLASEGLVDRSEELGARTRVRYINMPCWNKIIEYYTGVNSFELSHVDFDIYAREIQFHMNTELDYRPRRGRKAGK